MRTAIVLKGYPRLSETFIAQEILELEKRGLSIEIVSLRHPTDTKTHSIHNEIKASVLYLPEYLFGEIGRVWRAWRHVRSWPSYPKVFKVWLKDLRLDLTVNRIRRLGQSLVLASELSRDIDHLHVHFLHTPASVARYAAKLRQIPWSCSAHAVDIWTIPRWEVRDKLTDCKWLVTCTRINQVYLQSLTDDPAKVYLAYHGLNMERFETTKKKQLPRTPVRLLSVGRAVEKKGYKDLLAALALLPKELDWSFVHIGVGPELNQLKLMAKFRGISDRVTWLGSRSQEEVIAAYRDADIFVLACKVAKNGDRDGLPNVLMEAQSQGLPCVSTNVSAITECIEDKVTGLLVEPGDIEELSAQLTRLIGSAELRSSLGSVGQKYVRQNFEFHICFEVIADLFDLSAGSDIEKVA